jgi:hypothetical protein
MSAEEIVKILLEEVEPELRNPIREATVHLTPRSRVWVATFSGSEPGKQVWKSTGLADRSQALLLAKKWEAEARQQRATWRGFKKPSIRIRHPSASGGLSQKEVAMLLKMSERGVREVERRAFKKLSQHPILKEIWRQYLAGDLDEQAPQPLTLAEIQSLFDLARTPDEQAVIRKVLRLIRG